MTETKGKIFLADERGCNEMEWFRSYYTFNFGKYYNEHKHSFAGLYALNDDTLAGGSSLTMTIEEDTIVMLLPVVGALTFKHGVGNEGIVNAGQLQILHLKKDDTIALSNPYEDALVNFVQLWVKADYQQTKKQPLLLSFDLNKNKNTLIPVTGTVTNAIDVLKTYPAVSIGKFTGRNEAVYQMKSEQNSLFVFIIQGVFEVQGRLLHARDGLGLWNKQTR